MRIKEALTLRVEDIDSQMNRVHIRCGKGRKDRYVPLPARTLKALRYYWKTHRHPEWLFPSTASGCDGVMGSAGVQNAIKQVAKECGISKRVTPHLLRHCYATHLLMRGLDVCSLKPLMGHAHLSTTMHYLHQCEGSHVTTQDCVNELADELVLTWEKQSCQWLARQ